MQHFKLVNSWIRGFVFWCHEQVICWIGYEVLARQGSVEILIYSSHQNTCFWVFLFPQIDWGKCQNVINALFSQKSFAKKFSKIQGQIILWRSFVKFKSRVRRSFFLLTFFSYSYSAFGLSLLIYSVLSKNEMIHSVPKSKIQNLNLSITFHLMI